MVLDPPPGSVPLARAGSKGTRGLPGGVLGSLGQGVGPRQRKSADLGSDLRKRAAGQLILAGLKGGSFAAENRSTKCCSESALNQVRNLPKYKYIYKSI